jgi:hypothetical protein
VSLSDLVRRSGHVVCYTTPSELAMLKLACRAAGIPPCSTRRLRKRSDVYDVLVDTDSPLTAVAVLTCKDSALARKIATQKARLLVYDDTPAARDAHRLRAMSAFVTSSQIDVVSMFPMIRMPAGNRTSALLCAQVVLVTPSTPKRDDDDDSTLADDVIRSVLMPGDTGGEDALAVNNLYEMRGVPYNRLARDVLRDVNRASRRKKTESDTNGTRIGRPEVSVMEEFANSPQHAAASPPPILPPLAANDHARPVDSGAFVLAPARHVRGFVESVGRGARRFLSDEAVVDGVRLREGDRVWLSMQRRGPEENGYYFVTSRSSSGAVMESPAPVRKQHIRAVLTKDVVTYFWVPPVASHPVTLRAGDHVLIDRATFGVVERMHHGDALVKAAVETPSSVHDDAKFHPLAICSIDSTIPVRELCESNGGVWDHPCDKDDDCPYFQSNKRYRNTRGGCVAGYCEMPVGVKRAGYRHFDNESKPVCYSCGSDPLRSGGECCKTQTLPDYAFEMDEFERLTSPHLQR